MSSPFSKKFCGKNPVKMSPLNQGGYEGGGDIAGAYYVPTGQMYADMFAKIGEATANIIDKPEVKYGDNKSKKEKLAQYAERVWGVTEGNLDDKAYAAIEKTEAFFKDLGIDTKLSDYTKDYEGTAEEIAKRFTNRGWKGLGERQALTPQDAEKIVKMAY